MDTRFSKYASFFWGRDPDLVCEPWAGVSPAVSVVRFPPAAVGFFRRFVAPLHDRRVYITHGMSKAAMLVPAGESSVYPSRIELIAYCPGAYVGAYDGLDMVAPLLQGLAAIPFEMSSFFGPMQTASFERNICPGTDMSAFFFAVPDGVEMSRLCSCTPQAELVVSVMPITSSARSVYLGVSKSLFAPSNPGLKCHGLP
jgi:Suppressor of fused protein (SUFU)